MSRSNTNQDSASEKAAPTPPCLKDQVLFWLIVTVGVSADLWTKSAVFNWLKAQPGTEVTLIEGLLKFVMRQNPGAAFSLASNQTTMLITVSVVALIVVVAIFLFGRAHQRLVQIALALFAAGIIGNLFDRVFNNGYVRDFIDVFWRDYHWPAFNVADSMLCIAVGLLIIGNLTGSSSQKPVRQQKQAP